jgi:proteasome activator subunit 4
LANFWAQEDGRTHPSAANIDAVIASAQLFGPVIFDLIRPIVDGYLAEMDSTKVYDRHKTRAMWEFICGAVRGAEEWSGNKRQLVWDWLTPKLPELFSNVRHDTVKCWSVSIDFIMHERDPRRYPALMSFLIQTGLEADFANGSSFECKLDLTDTEADLQ